MIGGGGGRTKYRGREAEGMGLGTLRPSICGTYGYLSVVDLLCEPTLEFFTKLHMKQNLANLRRTEGNENRTHAIDMGGAAAHVVFGNRRADHQRVHRRQ